MLLKVSKFLLIRGFDLPLKRVVDVLDPFVIVILLEDHVSDIFVSHITGVTRLNKLAPGEPIVAGITLDFDPNTLGFYVLSTAFVLLEHVLARVNRTNLSPLRAVVAHVLKKFGDRIFLECGFIR